MFCIRPFARSARGGRDLIKLIEQILEPLVRLTLDAIHGLQTRTHVRIFADFMPFRLGFAALMSELMHYRLRQPPMQRGTGKRNGLFQSLSTASALLP